MGFHDLSLFNQATLGNQGWRLLTRLESLCARVLKGKYFPNSSFLSTRTAQKPGERFSLAGKHFLKA
jgi:hypothetical protein